MARQGTMKRADPKATGTAFRKAGKRSRDSDSGRETFQSKRTRSDGAPPKPSTKRTDGKGAPNPPAPWTKSPKGAFRGDKPLAKSKAPPKKQGRGPVHAPKALAKPEPKAKAGPTPAKRATDAPAKESKPRKTPGPAPASDPNVPRRGMRIISGSYERFLYGLSAFVRMDGDEYTYAIEPQFVFPAHVSSIRSVACAGADAKWLVTGGTDETIKVWDLRRRKEVGALIGHEGTITSLSFPSRTFMLSASEDGVLNLYRTRDWSLLRTLRGHTGRINSASAHPSGRIALSVGADRMIRMWDLMRGLGASSVKIGVEADKILWDSVGKRFAVLAGRQVMVFGTDMTKVAEIEQPKRLHDVSFARAKVGGAEHELMLVACESGVVHIYDLDDMLPAPAPENEEEDEELPSPRELARLVGHANRYVERLTAVCVASVWCLSLLRTTACLYWVPQSARTGSSVSLT